MKLHLASAQEVDMVGNVSLSESRAVISHGHISESMKPICGQELKAKDTA